MARVLVSYFRSDEISAGETLCFFDSFFKGLAELGNDVLAINNAYYSIYNPNRTDNEQVRNYLLSEALKFSPDLIITFNHRILQEILDMYKDIPVVIYDGDELRFFSDLHVIKRNISRYKVFSVSEDFRNSYIDFGFKQSQVFYMPPGTAIHNDSKVKQTMNISFLGQRRFFLSTKLRDAIVAGSDIDKLYKLYLTFLDSSDYDYEKLFRQIVAHSSDLHFSDSDLWPLFDQSYLLFANLVDLGLHLGGHEGKWRDILDFIPQIAVTHNTSRVFSLMENNDFYNSSRLSLCPMHPQSRGKAFSWRCFDIMASNAGLVSSYSSELASLTKGHVDLPMFHTPSQARSICEDLLKNEDRRREIVEASQRYVDNHCRWHHRIRDMQQILGVKLVNETTEGSIKKLSHTPYADHDLLGLAASTSEATTMPVNALGTVHEPLFPAIRARIKSAILKIHAKSITPQVMFYAAGSLFANAVILTCLRMGLFDIILSDKISLLLMYVFIPLTVVSAALAQFAVFFKFVFRAGVYLYRLVKGRMTLLLSRRALRRSAAARGVTASQLAPRKKLVADIRLLGSDHVCVFLPQGMGDILLFCMFADEYRQNNNNRKLAIIVIKPYYRELVELFPGLFEKIILIDPSIVDVAGIPGVTSFFHDIYDRANPTSNLRYAVMNAMGLGGYAQSFIPVIQLAQKDVSTFDDMGLSRGKSVLISTDAVSCSELISTSEWLQVAHTMQSKGYTVIFNSDSPIKYAPFKSVFLSIRDTIKLVNYCGNFIGYRSGLCDVVAAFCDSKQAVIYPHDKKKGEFPSIKDYDDSPSKKYMEFCSLSTMFSREIHEFIYSSKTLIKNTVDYF